MSKLAKGAAGNAPVKRASNYPQKETISLHGDIYKPVLWCANLNTFESDDEICWSSHRRVNVRRLVFPLF